MARCSSSAFAFFGALLDPLDPFWVEEVGVDPGLVEARALTPAAHHADDEGLSLCRKKKKKKKVNFFAVISGNLRMCAIFFVVISGTLGMY